MEGEGRKDVRRYVRRDSEQAVLNWEVEGLVELGGLGSWKGMKMPFVASEACCRKTVGFAAGERVDVVLGAAGRGSWRMSIGTERRWQAKMEFMMGMYWCARSVEGEAERRRIRDWSFEEVVVWGASGLSE